MKLDNTNRLEHILFAATKIERSLEISEKEFMSNPDKQDALVANLTIIGEAANQLSSDVLKKYPKVPWEKAIAMRNILVHAYHRIDYSLLWDTAKKDLPTLKTQIQNILKEEQKNFKEQSKSSDQDVEIGM